MYGAFVLQLIKDYRDVQTVNVELYKVYVSTLMFIIISTPSTHMVYSYANYLVQWNMRSASVRPPTHFSTLILIPSLPPPLNPQRVQYGHSSC